MFTQLTTTSWSSDYHALPDPLMFLSKHTELLRVIESQAGPLSARNVDEDILVLVPTDFLEPAIGNYRPTQDKPPVFILIDAGAGGQPIMMVRLRRNALGYFFWVDYGEYNDVFLSKEGKADRHLFEQYLQKIGPDALFEKLMMRQERDQRKTKMMEQTRTQQRQTRNAKRRVIKSHPFFETVGIAMGVALSDEEKLTVEHDSQAGKTRVKGKSRLICQAFLQSVIDHVYPHGHAHHIRLQRFSRELVKKLDDEEIDDDNVGFDIEYVPGLEMNFRVETFAFSLGIYAFD